VLLEKTEIEIRILAAAQIKLRSFLQNYSTLHHEVLKIQHQVLTRFLGNREREKASGRQRCSGGSMAFASPVQTRDTQTDNDPYVSHGYAFSHRTRFNLDVVFYPLQNRCLPKGKS